VNVITVTFNVAMTVKIVAPSSCHVEYTVNGPRRAALGAIEGEIPAATAAVTGMNPEVTSKVNMEGSVCVVLHEITVIYLARIFAVIFFPGALLPVHV